MSGKSELLTLTPLISARFYLRPGFSTLWLPRGFANFPKKTNSLIEVFPFRGLLIVGGSIASKSLDRCLQSGKVNGAPVSDAMEVLEEASEWPVPERKMANHKDSP